MYIEANWDSATGSLHSATFTQDHHLRNTAVVLYVFEEQRRAFIMLG